MTIATITQKVRHIGFHEKSEKLLIVFSILMNILTWVGAVYMARLGRTFTPLHYTIYFGIDLTVPAQHVYLLPGFGTLLILANLFAARAVNHIAWRQSWLSITLGAQILLAIIASFLIIITNAQ